MDSEIGNKNPLPNSMPNRSINELRSLTSDNFEPWTTRSVLSNEVSEEFLRNATSFLEIISRVFIGSLGIVGNCLSLLVLARQGLSDVTNVLLISLSACDFVYCLIIPVKMIRFLIDAYDPFLTQTFNTFWEVYIVNISIAVNYCSNTHVMVIALERVLVVFMPFEVSRIVTRQRVQICLTVLYMYVLVPVLLFTFIIITHTWGVDHLTNRTYARVEFTRFYCDNYNAINIYSAAVLNNLYRSLSVFVVIISCIAICLKLAHQHRVISVQASGTRSDHKAGKILMSVCVCYAICSFPTICYELFKSGLDSTDRYSLFITFLDQVFEIFYNMNTSMNFVLYMMTSSKFSRAYKEMFCGKCSKRNRFIQ